MDELESEQAQNMIVNTLIEMCALVWYNSPCWTNQVPWPSECVVNSYEHASKYVPEVGRGGIELEMLTCSYSLGLDISHRTKALLSTRGAVLQQLGAIHFILIYSGQDGCRQGRRLQKVSWSCVEMGLISLEEINGIRYDEDGLKRLLCGVGLYRSNCSVGNYIPIHCWQYVWLRSPLSQADTVIETTLEAMTNNVCPWACRYTPVRQYIRLSGVISPFQRSGYCVWDEPAG